MKKRIFYGIVVVIIIILIIYFVILLKRGILLKEDNPIVKELYQMSHPSKEVSVLNELYQENGFTNKYILAVGMKNYLKDYTKESVNKQELEKSIYDIFGDSIIFTNEDFDLHSNGICGYTYNKDTHTYEQLIECSENKNESYEQKIMSTNKVGNKIIIREKVLFLVKEDKTFVYTSFDKKDLIAEIENDLYEKEDYIDKGCTYEYTFISTNKNYILQDVHIIEE